MELIFMRKEKTEREDSHHSYMILLTEEGVVLYLSSLLAELKNSFLS